MGVLCQCRTQAQGSGGLLHPPIEAGQAGATAVERHRQMQGITGPQAEGWILQQICSLTEAATVQRTQFNAALQQSLELLSRSLAVLRPEAMLTLLDAQSADGFR